MCEHAGPSQTDPSEAILREYVAIHDAIFSFRGAGTPIPGLFKATDFWAHFRNSSLASERLLFH